jgi:hypothetical protein
MNAAIEFSPHVHNLEFLNDIEKRWSEELLLKFQINLLYEQLEGHEQFFIPPFDYEKYVEFQETREYPSYKYFPSVTPRWDNTPRCNEGKAPFIWNNSTPELFGRLLRHVLNKFRPYSDEENLVFINAWNEWGEGNHLEPDTKYGYGYLEQVKEAVEATYVSTEEKQETLAGIPAITQSNKKGIKYWLRGGGVSLL